MSLPRRGHLRHAGVLAAGAAIALLAGVAWLTAQSDPAQLSGVVLADDTGLPVKGATVRIVGRPDVAKTDDDGRFEIHNIPPGKYMVTGKAERFATSAAGQRTPRDRREPTSLRSGRQDIEIRLFPLGSISGRIVDESGKPARVSVTALLLIGDRADAGGARTDEDGRFVISGLERGNYYVLVTRGALGFERKPSSTVLPGNADGLTAFYPGTAWPDQAVTVSVDTAAATDASFTVPRIRLARVSGRVFDSAGNPASRFIVMPATKRPLTLPPASIGISTFDDGRFEMTNVPPGEYALEVVPDPRTVSSAPRSDPRMPGEGPRGETGRLPIRVDGEDIDVEIRTARGFLLKGRITGAPASPVGTAAVAAHPVVGYFSHVSATGRARVVDGTFELSDINGRHVIRVETLPKGMMVKQVLAGSVDVTDTGVEPTQNTEIEIELGPSTTVTGTVADRSGYVMPDAAVLAFAEDASVWRLPGTRYVKRVAARADGRFTIDGLPAGRYHIVAFESYGDMPAGNDILNQHITRATRVTVAEGGQQSITLKVD